jgi:hypothetical protein
MKFDFINRLENYDDKLAIFWSNIVTWIKNEKFVKR